MKYGSNYFVDEEVEVFPNFDLSPFFNIGKYRQTTISLTKKKESKISLKPKSRPESVAVQTTTA